MSDKTHNLSDLTPDTELLVAQKLRERLGLTDEEIEAVAAAFGEVCKRCFDGDLGCQCWNDE